MNATAVHATSASVPRAAPRLRAVIARAIRPRHPLTVSEWADAERVLSRKGSAEPGRWRTSRNPMLREPMDCFSARSNVHEVWCLFDIQSGKTECALNIIGYSMDHNPGPIMICLPGEAGMNAWIAQKLGPMLDETPAVQRALTSTASRDAANQRTFKDFAGGQLYLEHAGSPQRLKSKSVRTLIVDEADGFASALTSGDDPIALLEGRNSAFPSTYKRLYIGTPEIQGISRLEAGWNKSDQRHYLVPCPHCGHEQHLQWSGLHWSPDASEAWYACEDCGAVIDEHAKPDMLARGHWVAEHPERKVRGYHLNALYRPLGLGVRWRDLAATWLAAQGDPAKLKTFVNDRLAEPWEDPAMRAVKHNIVADRAEQYALRHAPAGVLAITAGVDTQDDRLAVQILGWGRGLVSWVLDYIELSGDPENDDVWIALTGLLNRPIEHASGARLRVEAVAIDAGGHRTQAVYNYVRQRLVRRIIPIFGAVPNNAPVLSKGRLVDVTWRGKLDKRGISVHHVGTVGIKHALYARLSTDAEKPAEARQAHFSAELSQAYFHGLISERYDPRKNRFIKVTTRNEPLDTWVYAFAAAHHPELRLHRLTRAEWDAREVRVAPPAPGAAAQNTIPPEPARIPRGTRQRAGGFATNWRNP
jgi:phage terminase large subunit GpA-like protein